MEEPMEAEPLRERIRQLERKLGILQESRQSRGGCISLAQCHALVEIGRTPKIALNELAEALNLDSSTMSRTVNKLVTNGLAKRDIDPVDRRYVTISLTDSGMNHFHAIESDQNAYFRKVYETIPVQKQQQVLESLRILIDAFSQRIEG